MPIVDIQIVSEGAAGWPARQPQELADALGDLFDVPPGRVWVRWSVLPAAHYAENRAVLDPNDLPVFVRVLHAHAPQGPARVEQLLTCTQAVARVTGRRVDQVHVELVSDGAGRVAFGGNPVV